MTISSWIERLKCPKCCKTGEATLSEIGPFKNRFDNVPEGFEVFTNQYGSYLRCEVCCVPAV